jgi:hypothetical protein
VPSTPQLTPGERLVAKAPACPKTPTLVADTPPTPVTLGAAEDGGAIDVTRPGRKPQFRRERAVVDQSKHTTLRAQSKHADIQGMESRTAGYAPSDDANINVAAANCDECRIGCHDFALQCFAVSLCEKRQYTAAGYG